MQGLLACPEVELLAIKNTFTLKGWIRNAAKKCFEYGSW